MVKKWFPGLFLVFLCVSFSYSQNSRSQNETSWEYLEISVVDNACSSRSYTCRHYHYFNSGVRFDGPASVDWINKSGWELANVMSNEGFLNGLLFRRAFNKERTEKEIEWLKTELDKERQTIKETKPVSDLVDLDRLEAIRKLDDFDKSEEARLRTALEKINNLPLKIISVSSDAASTDYSRVGAELVLDGTSIFLKDGNKYRSLEVDKYFKETVKQILDGLNVSSNSTINSNVQGISNGAFKPEIGKFSFSGNGVTLKVSVIVNYQNRQNIVAQGWIYGKWTTNPQ